MAEHNSVLKLLKDGKLSEKPYSNSLSMLVGKVTFGKTLFLATHSPDISDDCTSIICHCFGICFIL